MFKNFSLSYLNFLAIILIAVLFSFDAFSIIFDEKFDQKNNIDSQCIKNF